MTAQTLPQLVLEHAARTPRAVAQRHKRKGIWHPFTWAEVAARIEDLAAGFDALGVRPGDAVVIVGENEPEHLWAELAAQLVGARSVSLYPDISVPELEYICEDAEARLLVAHDQEQVDKCLALKPGSVTGIVHWDGAGLWGYSDPRLVAFDEVSARGAQAEPARRAALLDAARAAPGSTIACLSYTSGTTGKPKGVVVTHRFLLDNVARLRSGMRFRPGDEYLSYIPFAWATEQFLGVSLGLSVPLVVNFPERPDQVPANLRELAVHTVMFGARQWEGLASSVHARMLDAPRWRQRLVRWALAAALSVAEQAEAGKPLGLGARLRRWLADWTVLRGIRDQLGLTRVRVALMGGSAMAPDVFRFFHALGIRLRNIYGCSEFGLVAAHTGDRIRPDTAGELMKVAPEFGPPLEVKVTSEGELSLRGATGFAGYWRRPDATAEKMPDGWFRTGDVVAVNGDELVYIDRLQDLRSLADGTRFPPQFLETRLRFSPFIKDVLVVGDSTRSFVSAFVNIDPVVVGRWAEERRLAFSGFADLSQHPDVVALVRGEIERINRYLEERARVRRFANFPKELDPDEGELTRTRKLRREFVQQRYQALIEALYAGDSGHQLSIDVAFQDGRRGSFSHDVRIEAVG
jgi:long-chain acyl-CoA synthetase